MRGLDDGRDASAVEAVSKKVASLLMPTATGHKVLSKRKEKKKKGPETHKIPQLMATATPIFSFLFICSPQISFHGRSARLKSIAAEYAAEKML